MINMWYFKAQTISLAFTQFLHITFESHTTSSSYNILEQTNQIEYMLLHEEEYNLTCDLKIIIKTSITESAILQLINVNIFYLFLISLMLVLLVRVLQRNRINRIYTDI